MCLLCDFPAAVFYGAGEGACIVDAKNSMVKGFMYRNVANGICDVVCAESYAACISAGDGLRGLLVLLMEAEDVQKQRDHWSAPARVDGISKLRCEAFNDDGSMTEHRSALIGPGRNRNAAEILELWGGRLPSKPSVRYKVVSHPSHLKRGITKGTFHDEAEKQQALAALRAASAALVAPGVQPPALTPDSAAAASPEFSCVSLVATATDAWCQTTL